MKKRYILILGSMLIVGQSFLSYQSIVQNATMHIKLQKLQSEKRFGKVQTTSSNGSIKYVTYEYKKKKDFKHIEDKIIQLKHEKALPSGSHTMQSELSKIVVSLSGSLLIGKKV